MAISSVEYQGNLRTSAQHLKSKEVIITDAPTDNEGKGEAFSPTDLLSTSLASCMITLMGITANKNGFSLGRVSASVSKGMLSSPRRVGRIGVALEIGGTYSEQQMRQLEYAALHCPVANSLSQEIEQDVSFEYPDLKS